MTNVLFIAWCLIAAPTPSPKDAEARLHEALANFDAAVAAKSHSGPESQRLYRRALDGFLSLINDGHRTGALYYNAANTYLRLGDVGRSIVHYRRALRLDPGNERIRKNLQAARNMCETPISKPATSAFLETLLFWHFSTSTASRLRICLAGYALFWVMMLAMVLLPRRVPALTWTAVVLVGLAVVTGSSVAWDRLTQTNHVEGVLVSDKVVLRKGNGDYYDPQFDRPLSQGVEFRVLETRQDVQGATWYHVELPDNKDGWLRADQAEVI